MYPATVGWMERKRNPTFVSPRRFAPPLLICDASHRWIRMSDCASLHPTYGLPTLRLLMSSLKKNAWASVKSNKDFVCIQTRSGCQSLNLPDPEGEEFFLMHDVSDEEMGKALISALSASRYLDIKECQASGNNFFDYRGRVEPEYKEWVDRTMARFGYKTKRTMFKDMLSCNVEVSNGLIMICPWHHVKLEALDGEGLTEADNVMISFNAPLVEVGVSLRLALSRCT
jgi:hypothetical protein